MLGQRFAVDALRHLIEQPGYDCRVLVDHFLVRADGSELMFCHALIRDGAYASLLHARGAGCTRAAGEWFAGRDLVLAAEHFDRADDARAAAAYLGAANALAAQFRLPAAIALVERGIALATEQKTRFALLMARGRLLPSSAARSTRSTPAVRARRARRRR